MTLGETIRKMRRARNITQEDLAELLHITPQAVSRWENDTTSPDASAIVSLARIFGCTTDELLGMNNAEKKERSKYYKNLIGETYASNRPDGADIIAICRDALREVPDDFDMMRRFSCDLCYFSDYYKDSDPEKQRAMMDESITLLKYITAHCTNSMILAESFRQLHRHLLIVGRKDEAKQYLSYFSSLGDSREMLEFEVGNRWKEENLISLLVHNLQLYSSLRLHDKKKTPEQQVEIAHQLEGLYSIYNLKGEYRFYTPLAWAYAGMEDAEKTLFNLRRAALAAAEQDNPEGKYAKSVIWNSPKDNRDAVAEELADPRYDFVRDTSEFAEILSIIAK